jgi:phage-related protein
MAEPPSKDPAAGWRDLVAQWEKNLNELANRTMGSDEFSKAINQAVGLSAGMQSSLSEAMGRYLASLNPSRAEMAGIGERLHAIEERLDRPAGRSR